MKRCAICNKEINSGIVVETECLEHLLFELEKTTEIKDEYIKQCNEKNRQIAEKNAEIRNLIKALQNKETRTRRIND